MKEVNSVDVDLVVQREVVSVYRREALVSEKNNYVRDGMNVGAKKLSWVPERAGCIGGEETQVRLKRVEEYSYGR
ncbi:hypothetical protein Tsubulata_033469, partial [Turnera subulata]